MLPLNRLTTLTLIFLFPFFALAQESEFGFCELIQDWTKLKIVDQPLPDSLTKMLVVTNRPFDPDNEEGIYFKNGIADYRQVTYLEVACIGNEWIMHKVDDFNAGMKSIDHGNDLLLFIHGHGKSFPMSLTSAFQLQNRYGVGIILFDWPAQNSNFNKSIARVRRCSENFYNLLLNLKMYRENTMRDSQHLSVLAHSLGNYFLSYLVVNGNWQYQTVPFIDNLVLNAPAIRSKEHGKVLSLLNIAKRKYVAFNKNDRVLRGAQMLTSGKMLGNMVIEPKAENTTYIDFTHIVAKQHTWFSGFYAFEYETKGVFYFYENSLHGREVDFSEDLFKPLGKSEFGVYR